CPPAPTGAGPWRNESNPVQVSTGTWVSARNEPMNRGASGVPGGGMSRAEEASIDEVQGSGKPARSILGPWSSFLPRANRPERRKGLNRFPILAAWRRRAPRGRRGKTNPIPQNLRGDKDLGRETCEHGGRRTVRPRTPARGGGRR